AAEIHFEGYGTGIPAVPGRERRRDDALVFFVNAHGTPLQASPEQYAAFFSARKDYALTDNADAGRCYFNGMVLRVLRGCEYLASRPEWNRRDLEVVGGSQGGLQALWAAALDANVSHCAVEVPWNCNMAGRTFGLMAPDWGIAQYEPALEYYDPVHFAGHIRCPVVISRAGMGDYICPPSGVARMYFNLKCPKKITWIQNSDHGFAPPGAARWTFQEP
ncbi:MAG: acetylxylan esterase, partial [Victivallaceae bacterium]|nr:acetylxylan esterase [Victivallaceae bacterium]